MAWTSRRNLEFTDLWSGMLQMKYERKQQRIHPTEKPKQLYKWIWIILQKKVTEIIDTYLGQRKHCLSL